MLYIFRRHVIPITLILNFSEDYSDFIIPRVIDYVPHVSSYTNGTYIIFIFKCKFIL